MSDKLLTLSSNRAGTLVIFIAIMLLIWALASYLLYWYCAPSPRVCFPPLQGCVSISATGMTELSGIIYRAIILPLAPFVGLGFYIGVRFLDRKKPLLPWQRAWLIVSGGILCPLFLIITEAILNGTFHTPYAHVHMIFAYLAFLMPVLYLPVFSFLLRQTIKTAITRMLCIISILCIPCYLCMLLDLVPIHRFKTIMEWDLFILLCLWIIMLGMSIKQYSTRG